MGFFPSGWGEYPPEYNRAVHGPYNPSVYYGKRDTPFTEVKLGELVPWFRRRNKTPRAVAQAISRAWWRYQLKWAQPVKPGPAFMFQIGFFATFVSFLLNYDRHRMERQYRYH